MDYHWTENNKKASKKSVKWSDKQFLMRKVKANVCFCDCWTLISLEQVIKTKRRVNHVTPTLCPDWLPPLSITGGGRVYSMVGRLEFSDEKQLLKRNVFSPWRKKTRAEPQRSSHGTGKWCLQQSVLPGRTAVGPGSGGESCVGEFDSENDTRSTDNSVKLATWLKVSASGLCFSKQRRHCWGYCF